MSEEYESVLRADFEIIESSKPVAIFLFKSNEDCLCFFNSILYLEVDKILNFTLLHTNVQIDGK